MRIRLTYADQNERFRSAFPQDSVLGTTLRRVALKDWGDDWYILALDHPFEYNRKSHQQVLIRSRWAGRPLGGKDPTSVFILLISDSSALDKPLPESSDFEHAAWGMAETEPSS